MTTPGWNPDPTGRHEYRWWDGTQWTERVADGGATAVDPLDATGPGGGRQRPVLLFAVIAAIAFVGALGFVVLGLTGDDEGAGGDAASEACSLLSEAEVSAALGRPFEAGSPIEELGAPGCGWPSTEPSAELDGPLELELFTFDLTAADRETFDTLLAGDVNEPVPVGDQAVVRCDLRGDIGSSCDAWGPVFAAVGDRYVAIELGNYSWPGDISQDELLAGLTELTDLAVGRLAAAG